MVFSLKVSQVLASTIYAASESRFLAQTEHSTNHSSTDQQLLQFFRPCRAKIAGGGADAFSTYMPIEKEAFLFLKKVSIALISAISFTALSRDGAT